MLVSLQTLLPVLLGVSKEGQRSGTRWGRAYASDGEGRNLNRPSKPLPRWRFYLFSGGMTCILASITSMAISAFRAHQTTDFLEQARIAIPFIRWGLLCSFFAVILSGFGRGPGRWIGLISSTLLLMWWLLIAVSIY